MDNYEIRNRIVKHQGVLMGDVVIDHFYPNPLETNSWGGGGGERYLTPFYSVIPDPLIAKQCSDFRIRKFLGLPNRDPLVRGTDPDANPSLFS